jgi:hypothetical protein
MTNTDVVLSVWALTALYVYGVDIYTSEREEESPLARNSPPAVLNRVLSRPSLVS